MVKNRSFAARAIAMVAAAFVFVASTPEVAVAAKKKKNTQGKEEFEKGARYYKAQEYEAALPWFQKAYELSGKRPSTIRALAQCERSLKMYDEAIIHFREYLATKPSAAEAKSVKKTIELLEELKVSRDALAAVKKDEPEEKTPPIGSIASKQKVEKLDESADATPPLDAAPVITESRVETKTETKETIVETPPATELREVPPPRHQPTTPPLTTADTMIERKSNAVPWIVVGTSAAATIFGATLFAIGRNDVSKVESAPDGTPFRGEIADAAGRAPAFTGLGIGMLVAGLVGTGIGVTMLLSDD